MALLYNRQYIAYKGHLNNAKGSYQEQAPRTLGRGCQLMGVVLSLCIAFKAVYVVLLDFRNRHMWIEGEDTW